MSASVALQEDYERVLYPGHSLPQAHPDRLATLACLFGLRPPALDSCRILELGCGDGTNLIAVAQSLPHADCLGIDLAEAGLRRGRDIVERLRLQNIRLQQMDLLDIDEQLGKFDYIIAHGLYSWVPEEVRDRLLDVCGVNLTHGGVAYVSYNAYPGCQLRQMVRGMMQFHTQHSDTADERVAQGRGLINFLAGACTSDPPFYQAVLSRESERLNECLESTVFHDDLAAVNHPVYFHQFIDHAACHGLQYLSEAHFFEMQTATLAPDTVEVLNRISDSRIAKEQYLDFIKCRSFRQTLLVHADLALDPELKPERIERFFVASALRLKEQSSRLDDAGPWEFVGPKKSRLRTDNRVVAAALQCLADVFPDALHVGQIVSAALARIAGQVSSPIDVTDAARQICTMLVRAFAGGLVEFHVHPPRFARLPGARPVGSPLARVQVEMGTLVTNLRHHNVQVEDPFRRVLLQLLDGTRDHDALLDELETLIELEPATAGAACAMSVREVLREKLDETLRAMGQMALLEA